MEGDSPAYVSASSDDRTVAMSGSPFDTPRAFGSGWSDR